MEKSNNTNVSLTPDQIVGSGYACVMIVDDDQSIKYYQKIHLNYCEKRESAEDYKKQYLRTYCHVEGFRQFYAENYSKQIKETLNQSPQIPDDFLITLLRRFKDTDHQLITIDDICNVYRDYSADKLLVVPVNVIHKTDGTKCYEYDLSNHEGCYKEVKPTNPKKPKELGEVLIDGVVYSVNIQISNDGEILENLFQFIAKANTYIVVMGKYLPTNDYFFSFGTICGNKIDMDNICSSWEDLPFIKDHFHEFFESNTFGQCSQFQDIKSIVTGIFDYCYRYLDVQLDK